MKYIAIIILALTLISTAFPRSAAAEENGKTKSFAVTRGGSLEVAVSGGDIRISTWEKNEVSVSTEGFDDDEDSDFRIRQTGNTVRISDRDNTGNDGRLDISIPSQFNLNIETSDGDISVRGKLTGNITGETSAGNITLGDVEGTVDMQTSGGDIRTGKIGGRGTLHTSGGEVEIASSTGELDVKSSGGDIRVGNVGKSLRAKTAGGDIVIGDVGGEAVVSTAGGNVRVGKVSGQASLNTAGGDVELNGGNGAIRANTSGGNITLLNMSGSVNASTAGGDVYAELRPTGKGQSKLSSANGTIKLSIPENAKATITARIRIQGWWREKRDDYKIRSEFKEQSSMRSADDREIESKYVLNGGGEDIILETVNSDIIIRKSIK